ncbi:chromosome partitioning protein ParB [Nostoc spongiaeforme FACHB-130]|uniref:Chromosome partitioning protein ParB n=1 Tax=Nostoc spongiaeforme FACHB-130 TaxID=1357510 RepID=A0ABR8FX90_9NOSO|nr:chromosome partitioning protein ParB [Nostoc spongiaeforme]MBD2594853.1 chromosome partitioning protein ParB [Nostoc spongiaeforme FACHB-130]
MMKFYLVDVKDINSNIPRSNFSEADLDNLAEIILESGGIIRPLVLKPTDAENYTVIDGHFEYYAAVKAKEKNPRKGEMVNAFVISPKNEDILLKQVAAFRELKYSNTIEANIVSTETNKSKLSLEKEEISLIEKQINDLRLELAQEKKERQKLYEYIKSVENQIPKQITPLEAFNSLNVLELTLRLRTAGFTDKKAAQVAESIEKVRKKKPFDSLKDVIARVTITSGKKQVKGISGDKMVDIIDSWSRLVFK